MMHVTRMTIVPERVDGTYLVHTHGRVRGVIYGCTLELNDADLSDLIGRINLRCRYNGGEMIDFGYAIDVFTGTLPIGLGLSWMESRLVYITNSDEIFI